MTSLNTKRIYTIESLSKIFVLAQRSYHTEFEYDDDVGEVKTNEGTLSISALKDVQKLYETGKQSYVGKGSQTLLDKQVRSSKEHINFTLYKYFIHEIEMLVETGLEKMNAGTLVSIKPHKLVIYGKDDFFSKHIDSVHTSGQNMSCVVELDHPYEGFNCIYKDDNQNKEHGLVARPKEKDNTEEDEDKKCGALIVNGELLERRNGKCLLALFYNDCEHEVEQIFNGYRVSITFDLVVNPLKNKEEEKTTLEKDMKYLYNSGIKRIGFFALNKYIEEQQLKGADAQVVNMLKPYIKNHKMLDLKHNGCSWYHPKIFSYNSEQFGMIEIEDEGEDTRCGDDYSPIQFPKPKSLSELNSSYYVVENDTVFKDKYCLGDIVVLWSPCEPVQTHRGNDEIHLGNEGISGCFHRNPFIVCELKDTF